MEGNYQNPHAIQPSEELDPQQLFERYIAWFLHQRAEDALSRKDVCDPHLYTSFLCCPDHFRLTSENAVFFRYFKHLNMYFGKEDGFSQQEIVSMIKKFNLILPDPSIIELF